LGVNHLEGHIWSNRLSHPHLSPPFITLIASGGHTQIVFVKEWGLYEVMGRTKDDAAGEAFDKVSKMLELGYPGGPVIEKCARQGDINYKRFPRAFLGKSSLDFSFSGIKTAVLNHVKILGPVEVKNNINNIAASFQDAVVDVLVDKTIAAAKLINVNHICLAGGVAVNAVLKNHMALGVVSRGLDVTWPHAELCTDNGGMIARAGYHYLLQGFQSPLSMAPNPSLNL